MFIVFEGISKCGKSTQISRLIRWLSSAKIKTYQTEEPHGKEFKRLIKEAKHAPDRELDLRIQDRKEHSKYIIKPWLDCGFWIISERFVLRDVVHFGCGNELDIPRIYQLNEKATEGLKPDLTIVLDCYVENAINRGIELKYNRIYLEKIRLSYLKLAGQNGYTIIDGNQSENKVFSVIRDVVMPFVPEECKEFMGVKLFV